MARPRTSRKPREARSASAPAIPTPGTTPWYEDDAAWVRFAPVIFPPERLATATLDVDALTALLELAPGAAVLDLCCGVGRHTVELARRGHPVTGVDRTAPFLERARAAAAEAGVSPELVLAPMDTFVRPGAFNVALSLYSSFGYHAEAARDRQTLANVRASLKPGGRLVMQLHGKEELERNFRARSWHRIDGGSTLFEQQTLALPVARAETHWTLYDADGRHDLHFSIHLYAAAELEALLRSCGFTSVAVYGGLDRRPYDDDALHLVVVAGV